MCTHYSAHLDADQLREHFHAKVAHITINQKGDFWPKSQAPVIRESDAARTVEFMQWGFEPPPKGKAPVVNVRNLAAPFWKPTLENPNQRCLVPATRFCEWEGSSGKKIKRWFTVRSSVCFAFAGIWKSERDGTKRFAFLTCESNPLVAPIHPKAMPVILAPNNYLLRQPNPQQEAQQDGERTIERSR